MNVEIDQPGPSDKKILEITNHLMIEAVPKFSLQQRYFRLAGRWFTCIVYDPPPPVARSSPPGNERRVPSPSPRMVSIIAYEIFSPA
jgi:hypothetical protein